MEFKCENCGKEMKPSRITKRAQGDFDIYCVCEECKRARILKVKYSLGLIENCKYEDAFIKEK